MPSSLNILHPPEQNHSPVTCHLVYSCVSMAVLHLLCAQSISRSRLEDRAAQGQWMMGGCGGEQRQVQSQARSPGVGRGMSLPRASWDG